MGAADEGRDGGRDMAGPNVPVPEVGLPPRPRPPPAPGAIRGALRWLRDPGDADIGLPLISLPEVGVVGN